MVFTINGCNSAPKDVDVQAGDWVDVSSSAVGSDPQWGFSLEVVSIDEFNQIWCNIWNGTSYDLSVLNEYWIIDSFRKVPEEV